MLRFQRWPRDFQKHLAESLSSKVVRLANFASGSIGSSCAEDLSMSSGGGGSVHVFVESYDFSIIDCEHMRKVTPELPAVRSNTPGILTQSHDFITLSDKLSWIKMLHFLSTS